MSIPSDKNKAPREIQDQIRARVVELKNVVEAIAAYKPLFTKEEILLTLMDSGFIDPMEYSLTEISMITSIPITTLWRVQEKAMETLDAEKDSILYEVSRCVDVNL